MGGGREKQFAVENIERNSEPIALLCDNIFYFAELGMQEFETSGLEYDLTTLVRKLTRDKTPKVAFVSGKGGPEPEKELSNV